MTRALGDITRGTTNPNRLRRADRWLLATHLPLLRSTPENPCAIVDLGYGAAAITTLELAYRINQHPGLRDLRPGAIEVHGHEIDPERVALARESLSAAQRARAEGRHHPLAHLITDRIPVRFDYGGFEIRLPGNKQAHMIRAFNVLRQYDESEVRAAWEAMTSRLAPGGILIDGTCNELGQRMTWVTLTSEGPQTLTIALKFAAFATPSDVAERLPKILIHHNVPGQRIHKFFTDWDEAWTRTAHLISFGTRQRFIAAANLLREADWPILSNKKRHRQGEITIAWDAVKP